MDDEETGKLSLKIGEKDPNGYYVRLEDGVETEAPSSSSSCSSSNIGSLNCNRLWVSIWWWTKLALLVTFLALLGAVFLKWVGPFIMDKEIIPALNWETVTFNRAELAILVFASVAFLPTLFLPSSPSIWVAGMTFGCGYGFLLVIGAATIGVSLPYFIGSLLLHKIKGLLERYPKRASLIRLAGEGNAFDQFRAVALIRISPFPYIIYNYCAVATGVAYLPYLLGSLAGMVLEIFLTLYTGIVIKTLADASKDHQYLSAPQIIFNVVGFCVTVGTTVIVTLYAKGRLKELHKEEELVY